MTAWVYLGRDRWAEFASKEAALVFAAASKAEKAVHAGPIREGVDWNDAVLAKRATR